MTEREITALLLSLAPTDLPPVEHSPADLYPVVLPHDRTPEE